MGKFNINLAAHSTFGSRLLRPASRLALGFLIAGLAGGGGNAQSTAVACKFKYNANIRTNIVLPELQAKEGRFASNFDLDSPGIVNKKNRIELVFGLKQKVMDPPNFVIVLKRCTLRVLESGETAPFTIVK